MRTVSPIWRTAAGAAAAGPAGAARLRFGLGCRLALAMLGGLAGSGCRDDDPGGRSIILTGTVEEIDLAHSRVQISFFSDKYQRNVSTEAYVTPETEVLINGMAAKLTDVKVGERAEGEALVSRRDGDRHVIIRRVRIERATPILPQRPAPPASQNG